MVARGPTPMAAMHAGTQDAARLVPDAAAHDAARTDAGVPHGDAAACGACPPDYTCGSANGLPVCRAASGIPLFSHVFLIMEENTSLSTLVASINANAAPNFASMRTKYASGTDYHGVSHPSLPNYVALTSAVTQGIGCDCARPVEPGDVRHVQLYAAHGELHVHPEREEPRGPDSRR